MHYTIMISLVLVVSQIVFVIIPWTIVYNTKTLSPSDRFKNWFDLAHPCFKGKLAIEQEQVTWYAGILKRHGAEKGKQYMQALAKLDPRPEQSSRGKAPGGPLGVALKNRLSSLLN